MFEAHREKMMKFMLLNQDYAKDKKKWKEKFDCEGMEIIKIVEECKNKLCGQMERGTYGKYSATLDEKFMGEVLKYFPYYYEINVKIIYA